MSALTWVAFLVAGAVGAPTRFLLDGWVQGRTGGAYPWGTFVINVTGSFLLGVLTGLSLYHGVPAAWKTVLGSGFCGAYTTFSTFTFESVRLAEEGAVGDALRNVGATMVSGLAAAGLGLLLIAML